MQRLFGGWGFRIGICICVCICTCICNLPKFVTIVSREDFMKCLYTCILSFGFVKIVWWLGGFQDRSHARLAAWKIGTTAPLALAKMEKYCVQCSKSIYNSIYFGGSAIWEQFPDNPIFFLVLPLQADRWEDFEADGGLYLKYQYSGSNILETEFWKHYNGSSILKRVFADLWKSHARVASWRLVVFWSWWEYSGSKIL